MNFTRASVPFVLFVVLFVASILITYYSKVVLKDYEVITNEDGIPVLDN